MEEYDGLQNPRSIVLDKITIWAQVMKLPDLYLKAPIIKGMCRSMGEILEVQIKLPAGYIGEFVRVRAKMDINKKIIRFVSMTRDNKKEWYQVKYEKLPTFCHNCGYIGHWYEECGDGIHDASKFEWGEFILAPSGRGGGRGRRGGRAPFDNAPFMGRGRGRSSDMPPGMYPGRHDLNNGKDGDNGEEMDVNDGVLNSRKRLNFDGQMLNQQALAIVGDKTVANMVGIFDGNGTGTNSDGGTPGKVQAQKKSRTGKEDLNDKISATSVSEVDRTQ
jgi:hypothetical protein